MKKTCHDCGKLLKGFDLEDIIQAEQEFRETFKKTWHLHDRVLLCDDCYNKVDFSGVEDWENRNEWRNQ